MLLSTRCSGNARHSCDVLSSQTCLNADLTSRENIWKKWFLVWHPLSWLPPTFCAPPHQCAVHITAARAVRNWMQIQHWPKVLIVSWDWRHWSRQLCSIMTKYAEQCGREEHAPCLLFSVQLRGMLISMFISMAFIATIISLLHWIFLLYSLE